MTTEKVKNKNAVLLTASERSTLEMYLSDLMTSSPRLHPLQTKVVAGVVTNFHAEHHVPSVMHHIVDAIKYTHGHMAAGGPQLYAQEQAVLGSLHAVYDMLAELWDSRSLRWDA